MDRRLPSRSLILLTMCRKSISYIRRVTWLKRWLPVMRQVVWHKWVAFHIVMFAITHIGAHITNYNHVSGYVRWRSLE